MAPGLRLPRAGAVGFLGNFVPAGYVGDLGSSWCAVNSVSAPFALLKLVPLPFWLALVVVVLLQVIVAFFGHILVHVWERCWVVVAPIGSMPTLAVGALS